MLGVVQLMFDSRIGGAAAAPAAAEGHTHSGQHESPHHEKVFAWLYLLKSYENMGEIVAIAVVVCIPGVAVTVMQGVRVLPGSPACV